MPLAVGDHLTRPQLGNQFSCLELNQQATAAPTSSRARHQKAQRARVCQEQGVGGDGSLTLTQAATTSVLPARWRRVRKPNSTLPMAAIRLPSSSWNIFMLQWNASLASATIRSAIC